MAEPGFGPGARLGVQTILYMNDVAGVLRAAEAVAAAVAYARRAGRLGEWTLTIGDCSPHRVLDADADRRLGEIVASAGGTHRVEWFDKNLGSAAGHNRLLMASDAPIGLIMNPDGILAPDALAWLLSSLRADVGIVEARQLPIEHPKAYDSVTGETSWASTACALIDADLARHIGGFDAESFFLYCDDVDFSWRVRLAGRKVVYKPLARLFHDKRLLMNGLTDPGIAEIYYSAEAAMILAHKYSRPDLAESFALALAGGDEHQQRAAREFRRRQQTGQLPDPIDPDHRVSQFVNGAYAVHRVGASA